jgi:hypothetical protein
MCWEYFNEKPKIKKSKQPLGQDQVHKPADWAAQPCLEESWLGRERRDEPLAVGPHRRKKNKEAVASSLAGEMSAMLPMVGKKGGGGGFYRQPKAADVD